MNNKLRLKIGSVFIIIAVIVFFIALIIAQSAWSKPSYSPVSNWISDLGVPIDTYIGDNHVVSPLHAVMNFGFIAHALLVGFGYIILRPYLTQNRFIRILPIFYIIGVLFIGLFPGYDFQFSYLHGVGAIFLLISGHLLSILYGRYHIKLGYQRIGIIHIMLGIIGFIAIPVMFALVNSGWGGLIERIAIYPIFISMLIGSIFNIFTKKV